MIAIVKLDPSSKEPTGWIIAADIDDARRQAHGAGDMALATALYRMPSYPPPNTGKAEIMSGYWMLVA